MKLVDENVSLWEKITIIWNDENILSLYNDLEPDYENNTMKGLTLKDCEMEAKKHGYEDGTIMVLSESYLQGQIYRFNNYGKNEWYQIGELVGFA